MWGVAQRLESRVANLEKLLDAEAPGWREHKSMSWDNAGETPQAFSFFKKFRRDRTRGKISGVCAGIANYWDIKLKWVRVAAVLGAHFLADGDADRLRAGHFLHEGRRTAEPQPAARRRIPSRGRVVPLSAICRPISVSRPCGEIQANWKSARAPWNRR